MREDPYLKETQRGDIFMLKSANIASGCKIKVSAYLRWR